MSTHETILRGIRELRLRWLRVRFVRYALQSLFYLLLATAVVLLVFPDLDYATLAASLIVAAVAAGALSALLRRPSEAVVAKAYDDVAGLKDRISSSVELMGQEKTPMVTALIEEAAEATRRVPPKAVYPYTMPREGWWMPIPALLIGAVLFLPGLSGADTNPPPEVAQTIERRIGELEELISKEKSKEPTKRRKELIEELEELKAELSREKLQKKDAMAEIAKMLDQLESEKEAEKLKELELKKMLKGLKEKNKDLAEELQDGDYQDALNKLKEKLEELEKELEKKKKEGATPEELEALEEMIRELKEIEAMLLNMLQIDADLQMMGEAIEFLEFFEGDLADLEDMDFGGFLKPCDCDDPGS